MKGEFMAGPEGTLFPGLDGTPGEIPESTDITGIVLPSLSSDPQPTDGDYPLSEAAQNVSVHSFNRESHGNEPPAQMPQDVAVIDGTPRQPEPGTPRRSLDDKIDALIGATPSEGRTYAEDQLAQLTDALLQQGRQIEQLISNRRTPTPAPAPTGEVDPITGQAAGAPAPAPVSAGDIENVVSRALQNYDAEQQKARNATVQLQLSHEDSYRRAALDVPGIDDPTSPVHKTFLRIWTRSPLQKLPDGPYQVALQVQGLLAADAASNAALTQRKRQASPASPAPTATDQLGEGQVQALQAEYAKISQQLRNGVRDKDLMFKFRKLGRILGRTKQRR
jgi:hypothetical protein